MCQEAWFSISIREITFREQELNWLFAKYKRLENNPLYGIAHSCIGFMFVVRLRLPINYFEAHVNYFRPSVEKSRT